MSQRQSVLRRLPVLTSFIMFLGLCASVTYWLLQWLAPATRPVVIPAPTEHPLPDLSAAANLFGGQTGAVGAAPVQLKGIVLASQPNESVAIIGMNGNPARILKVNIADSDGMVIKQISAHGVTMKDHDTEYQLSLPAFSSPMSDRPSGSAEPSNKQN